MRARFRAGRRRRRPLAAVVNGADRTINFRRGDVLPEGGSLRRRPFGAPKKRAPTRRPFAAATVIVFRMTEQKEGAATSCTLRRALSVQTVARTRSAHFLTSMVPRASK